MLTRPSHGAEGPARLPPAWPPRGDRGKGCRVQPGVRAETPPGLPGSPVAIPGHCAECAECSAKHLTSPFSWVPMRLLEVADITALLKMMLCAGWSTGPRTDGSWV